MLSRVVPFRRKIDTVGWRSNELAECYRVVGLLARSGLPVSMDCGLTDEGEPWAVILREDTGDVLLHMARLDGTFVVVSAAGPVTHRGESLRAILDTAVRTGGLAMLTCRSVAANSEILRLHPATLIAALITAALIHTQTSQAALLEASSQREEWGASRADDARLTGFAAMSAPAALATAAASFVAVAIALHATQAGVALEVTPDDFIKAALELEAEPVGDAPTIVAPIELANLDLWHGETFTLSTMTSGHKLAGVWSDDAQTHARLEAVVTPKQMPLPNAADIPRLFVQQSLSLTWEVIDGHPFVNILPNIQNVIVEELSELILLAATTTLSSSSEQPAPVRPSFAAEPPPVRGGGDAPMISVALPVVGHEASPYAVSYQEALAVIYKRAALLLHLDRGEGASRTEASVSPGKGSEVALATPGVSVVSSSVSTNTDGGLPSADTPLARSTPVARDTTPQQAAPGASDVGEGSRPLTAAIQPATPSNAQILLEFTNGTEHVLRIDRDSLNGQFSGRLDTGDARKVLVFDAPWLEVKSFMLMPGVMMMEDDLLGGVNRAGMEMKASPVLLDLGGGLTLTLLGVMDFGFT